MTLALDTAPPETAPPRRFGARAPLRSSASALAFSGWDVMALVLLAALWAALFLVRYDALPMQLWDESRNANNALEMALHGRWLVPTYLGAPDHWNTKPPLLIWAMAGGLRLGLAPLIALRLPSWLAAAASVGAVWGLLRFEMKDRLAAFAAGVLLLSAVIYIGPHAARTGDYDALESAFLLGYVLCFWKAFEDGRTRWLFAAAVLMVLGVLTKGVAALLPLPGLGLYALTRPVALGGFLKDGRTWAAAALFLFVAGGYYLIREAYDPGYLSATAHNELGGRFLEITEHHRGSWHFYLRTLLQAAEPCAVLAALGLFPLFGRDARRRNLILACGLAAGALLVVLSASRSKMEWYATPLVPLLSLVTGLGLSDALRWLQFERPRWAGTGRAAAAVLLAAGALYGVWYNQTSPSWDAGEFGGPHLRYGEFLGRLRAQRFVLGIGPRLTVLDGGFYNDAGFAAYNPMLKFYAELSATRGLPVTVVHDADDLAPGAAFASCDPPAMAGLGKSHRLQTLLSDQGCALARMGAEKPSQPIGTPSDRQAAEAHRAVRPAEVLAQSR